MAAEKQLLERRMPLAEAAPIWVCRNGHSDPRRANVVLGATRIGKNVGFAVSELERVIREGERPRAEEQNDDT